MSLSALVYKNRSLSTDELALIGSKDADTGEPMLRDGDSYYDLFAAKQIFIGNLLGVAGLRGELERTAPEMSEAIRKFVISNGTLSGVGIHEPNVSRVASECSQLLAQESVRFPDYVMSFLFALGDLAETALDENSPITLI